MSKSKAIGTKAETAVVKAGRRLGFPFADRHVLKGALDEGDVWLCPGVIVEVKGGEMARAASDERINGWLAETERERINADAEIGFLVVQRRAVGEANAHRWWAITTTDVIARLLGAGKWQVVERDGTKTTSSRPVRLLLEDMLHLLRGAGWGDAL